MSSARSALRTVIRTVDQYVTSVNGNKRWRTHVLNEFRMNSSQTDPAVVSALLRKAENYAFLLRAVHHHKVRATDCCKLFG